MSDLFLFAFCQKNECFTSLTLYGARVRGNVFKIEFRVFSREFESIETSPGFTQLLEENWNESHKKITNQDQVRK